MYRGVSPFFKIKYGSGGREKSKRSEIKESEFIFSSLADGIICTIIIIRVDVISVYSVKHSLVMINYFWM